MDSAVILRRAEIEDLDFLVATDLLGEGYTLEEPAQALSAEEMQAHRAKIGAFVSEPDEAGWVVVDGESGQRVGMILARYRDHLHEPDTEPNRFLFRFLDAAIFPTDGRFCEIYDLWVHPAYRRKGLATRLKQAAEAEACRRGMSMMYTHTETRNSHVIELNRKLGYEVVRVGPLWDEVVRTSLVKKI